MSKEDLYSVINSYTRNISYDFEQLLDEFFASNVCIAKGANPHPYADVWHEWAEDTTREIQLYGNDYIWYSPITALNLKARIKPSEPVYKYRMLLLQSTGDYVLSEWMTIDEFNSSTLSGSILHETKRERK